jgi:lysophospholipase L1-like esterase
MPNAVRRAARMALAPLILVAGSLGAAALLLELAFRLLGVPVGTVQIGRATIRRSVNPGLLFELRPGASVRAEVLYEVNGSGMRGPAVSVEKPVGVTRLAVVGDSIAFGYWVEERDSFPRQLEGLLGGPRRVQVLNFGVPGYGLNQYVEMVRTRVGPFAPDVVVLAFCLNDLEGPMSRELSLTVDRAARGRGVVGRAYEAALGRSRLLAWVEYRLTELEARRTYVRARDNERVEAADPERQAALRSRFGAIAAILGPRRIPALVAVFPVFGRRFEGYGYRPLHRAIVGAAEEAGLGAVDLLDCYSAYDFRDVRVDLIHPSPLGHRIAAHAIAEALRARGFVDAAGPRPDHTCRDYRPADFPRVRGY